MAFPLSSILTYLLLLLLVTTTALLHPRDENFINTPGAPQNLCGDSTFEPTTTTTPHNGPLRDDCAALHRTVERNLHGFWMAGNMGGDGRAWVEFTRLRSCGVKVRRTDGATADVP